MLNYRIKINPENVNDDVLDWREKYFSPDMLFISGVTDQEYHLERLDTIRGSLYDDLIEMNVSSENVTRQGLVVIKGKKYKIYRRNDPNIETIVYRYVKINNYIYYIDKGKLRINNWLVKRDIKKTRNGENHYIPSAVTSSVTYSISDDAGYAEIDTVLWIEDGMVNIDGEYYIVDKDEMNSSGIGGLKYFDDGNVLPPEEITQCNGIEIYNISDGVDFIPVTKFRLTGMAETEVPIEKVTFCKRIFFLSYGGKYYQAKIVDGRHVCEIDDKLYDILDELGNEITTDNAPTCDDLYGLGPRIMFEDGRMLALDSMVSSDYFGNRINLYLDSTYYDINYGDVIRIKDVYSNETELDVEYIDGTPYVVFAGSKHEIVPDMMDTVVIRGVEHDIIRYESGNAYVMIDGEEVPMKVLGDSNTVQRQGYVVVKENESGRTMIYEPTYSIMRYSGVTIGGVDYRIRRTVDSGGSVMSESVLIEGGLSYDLYVEQTIGRNVLICRPYFDMLEFSQDYMDSVTHKICEDIVYNYEAFRVQIKNPIFTYKNVVPEDINSVDYFQKFVNNIILYLNTRHIDIPIKLETRTEPTILLEDTIKRDYADDEIQKVINPIIDMERDVYVPKYIDNSEESINAYIEAGGVVTGVTDLTKAYIGSFTDFKPIYEIQVNTHFRTRNLDNWKTNDGYNNVLTSGVTDNWFVTDYEPYKSILESNGETKPDDLLEVSDLMGLLYFTNIDVFYQKTAVGKSFARFSYYDDTNPQMQSLLHTSCVFVDEHDLFKKFTDNSRKNVYDYMMVEQPVFDDNNEEINVVRPIKKISVMSEFIGKHKSNDSTADYEFTDAKVLEENRRISSRLTIRNKYETDTSSEGFYLYIFKEYAENLHPKPIYMKVEFNHAKVGRTLSFVVPMKARTDEGEDYAYPVSAMTLSNDMNELKMGIPLTYVYGQSYIPLYGMYDFKNKEYVYVFDDRYIKVDDGVAKLNLFEMKVKNENDPENQTYRSFKIDINKNIDLFNENYK